MRLLALLLFTIGIQAGYSTEILTVEGATAIAKAELAKRNMAGKKFTVHLVTPREHEPFYLVELDDQKAPTMEELQKHPSLIAELKKGPKEFPAFMIDMTGCFSDGAKKVFEIRGVGYTSRMAGKTESTGFVPLSFGASEPVSLETTVRIVVKEDEARSRKSLESLQKKQNSRPLSSPAVRNFISAVIDRLPVKNQFLYLTEHPYGLVVAFETGLPASASSSATFT